VQLLIKGPRSARLTHGGYQILHPAHGGLVAGWGNANRGYALDLDDVEEWTEGEL
jgi:hypothetical protein